MGIDILDSIVTKITDKTYPNIKFYLHKDEINWKAQMDNMKEVMDICVEMWKETDWDAFWARQKFKKDDFKARFSDCKEETYDHPMAGACLLCHPAQGLHHHHRSL